MPTEKEHQKHQTTYAITNYIRTQLHYKIISIMPCDLCSLHDHAHMLYLMSNHYMRCTPNSKINRGEEQVFDLLFSALLRQGDAVTVLVDALDNPRQVYADAVSRSPSAGHTCVTPGNLPVHLLPDLGHGIHHRSAGLFLARTTTTLRHATGDG